MKPARKPAKPARKPASGTAINDVIHACPEPARAGLRALRQMILDTAGSTEGVGAIQEALKWGQPSYLTPETGSGSTIRIDRVKPADDQVAIFFHCQTDLVATFRELYPELSYSGNRAILLDARKKLPEKWMNCLLRLK